MKCPLCDVDLLMAERQGIEIDYCPKCRGIWLDRGELDKFIEQARTAEVSARPGQSAHERGRHQEDEYRDRHHDEHHHDKHGGYGRGHQKRKSIFDIFDFGD